MESITVVVVDDNPVVRMGLRSLLELDDSIEVVGEASSGPEGLDLVKNKRPRVALLDVRMPGGGGLEVLAELSQICMVLMLTYSDEPEVVSQAMRSGATSYLVHGAFDTSELARAIKDTANGDTRLSPAAAAILIRGVKTPGSVQPDTGVATDAGESRVSPEVARMYRLSPREVEISEEIVGGLTNGEIAKKLFIEEKTVKNHINRLFAKLGVLNRTTAVARLLGFADGVE